MRKTRYLRYRRVLELIESILRLVLNLVRIWLTLHCFISERVSNVYTRTNQGPVLTSESAVRWSAGALFCAHRMTHRFSATEVENPKAAVFRRTLLLRCREFA